MWLFVVAKVYCNSFASALVNSVYGVKEFEDDLKLESCQESCLRLPVSKELLEILDKEQGGCKLDEQTENKIKQLLLFEKIQNKLISRGF